MKKLLFGILTVLFVASPFWASAATMQSAESYYLDRASVVDDNLYAVGSDSNISGTVNGDLLTLGGNVFVSGQVNGDLMAAGGTLNMVGNVSGDARLGGGNVMVSMPVGGELLVAGGQVNIMDGASVGKAIGVAGGTVNFSGTVNGDMEVYADKVYINGTVGENLTVTAAEVKFGPKAVVKGNFEYYSDKEAVMETGASIWGQTDYHKAEMPKGKSDNGFAFGFLTVGWIIKSLAMFILILIALYLFRNQTNAIINGAMQGFWKNAGKGFAWLVLVPAAVLLSFITVIGGILGLIAGFIYAAFIIIASAMATLLFAQLTMKYVFKKDDYKLNWWIAIIAIIVMGVITLIPFVGWLFKLIIFLAAFYSLINYVFNKLKS